MLSIGSRYIVFGSTIGILAIPLAQNPVSGNLSVGNVFPSSASSNAGGGDITDQIFTERCADCAIFAGKDTANVMDVKRTLGFAADISVTFDASECVLSSNSIPNHDFNDESAQFRTNVAEVERSFIIPRNPTIAGTATQLHQTRFDAVMLNGIVVDLLSAGCYDPTNPMADADGNVLIGCRDTDPWLLDPLGTDHHFGADANNAHTQADGTYHYHGNPMAMFDDNPGPNGSPVIGFVTDGFPIYGTYFLDGAQVRKAVSGYSLKSGTRPTGRNNPGGKYDGSYVDDYEFTDAGDLDECNGMTVGGQYGYYVTDSYPWMIKCHSGTPHSSFDK